MRKSGLVSITFRNKTPLEILKLMQRANLSYVEWGGDVHVPVKGKKAAEVLNLTKDHGIGVCSYGSYVRLGQGTDAFRYALEEAKALETEVIRIWAGTKGSAQTIADERKYLLDELFEDSAYAKDAGVKIALEYHPNTLTDDTESVKTLLSEIRETKENVKLYWQPRWDWPEEKRLSALCDLQDVLSHLHVFTWKHIPGGIERLPLSEGEHMWKRVLNLTQDGYALLEFVKDDSFEQLIRDASTLNHWLGN